MSQNQQNSDDIFVEQLDSIIKPMINSVKMEMPNNPVTKEFFIKIFIFSQYR